ncbi:hypothetical protein BD410DRAFT_725659 [Rickenella mellea]|uniref:GH18 domain-containing protein n=1 Tax=Rickenella mellea TaxID=50990 RepID=A0A4Y7PZS8_9AGAM|nr:hypothetical protein BD410DRAFT_725659 [Rickenella mellea]
MVLTFSRRILCAALVLYSVLGVVYGTEVMHRPGAYKNPPNRFSIAKNASVEVVHKRASGKVQAGYFTNWGIYGANFQPTDIVTSTLTHIVYAFADVAPDTGVISLTDPYADEQKHFPGDSWSETGNNLYGCLKQMYLLKLANRNLKVLLSIGGWTYSQAGHFNFVTNPNSQSTFVSSAVQLIEDYGFDGIDIDFEYPTAGAQAQGFATLLTSLRTAFNQLAAKKGDSVPYQLTAAVPAGYPNYVNLVVPQMNAALTYWNLMAYDYAGSWLTFADNQANLYGGVRTNVSTDKAVKWYVSSGASPSKINMGIPLYGRAFEDTAGIGQPYNGIGPGTIEAGVYSYNTLPLAGAIVFENTTDVSSYSYDSVKQELVSYDTPHIVNLKAQYTIAQGMAGAMYWDLSTDKIGSSSLIGTAAGVFGSLDQTQAPLISNKRATSYPNSKWDNIRSNMGQGPNSPPPSTITTPTTSSTYPVSSPVKTTSTSSPTPSSPSGRCSGVAAWSPTIAYVGGQSVTYGGHLWTAKWWSEADTPGGPAGVWTDGGAC